MYDTDLIGYTFEKAQEIVLELGYKIRATSWDGESIMLDCDYDPKMIGVVVVDGLVVHPLYWFKEKERK